MSKLLDFIHKKQAAIQAQNNRLNTLRVKPGSNTYRILPSWRGEGEEFWHDYGTHFVKGVDGKIKSVFVCQEATHGKQCPICEYLRETRGRVDDTTGKILKESSAGRRVLVNVLEINGDKPRTPQVLEVSMTTFSEILNQFSLWGEKLISLENGNNVIIKRSGQGINTTYSVLVDPNPTKIPNGAEILKELTNLDEVVSFVDEQSMHRALDAINEVCGVLPPPSKPALTDVPMEKPVLSAPAEPVVDVVAEPVGGMPSVSNSELDDILAGLKID